jgi:hypothetical protein
MRQNFIPTSSDTGTQFLSRVLVILHHFGLCLVTVVYMICHNFPSLFQSHLRLSNFSTVCVPIGSDPEHIF